MRDPSWPPSIHCIAAGLGKLDQMAYGRHECRHRHDEHTGGDRDFAGRAAALQQKIAVELAQARCDQAEEQATHAGNQTAFHHLYDIVGFGRV